MKWPVEELAAILVVLQAELALHRVIGRIQPGNPIYIASTVATYPSEFFHNFEGLKIRGSAFLNGAIKGFFRLKSGEMFDQADAVVIFTLSNERSGLEFAATWTDMMRW